MTEYDLTKKQLINVLQAATSYAELELLQCIVDSAEEIKLLAQHLIVLHTSNAPRASNVP